MVSLGFASISKINISEFLAVMPARMYPLDYVEERAEFMRMVVRNVSYREYHYGCGIKLTDEANNRRVKQTVTIAPHDVKPAGLVSQELDDWIRGCEAEQRFHTGGGRDPVTFQAGAKLSLEQMLASSGLPNTATLVSEVSGPTGVSQETFGFDEEGHDGFPNSFGMEMID